MRALGLGFAMFVLSCSSCGGDDAKNPSAPSGSTSSGASGTTASGGTSSGSSGSTSSGSASSSGGTTSSSGNVDPTTPDDGLIPNTSIWRTKTEWYRVIDNAPLAEHSAEMMANVKTWGKFDIFQIDFSFNVLDGVGGTATNFPPPEEGDVAPVPVPAKGYVEGDNAYPDCDTVNEDCHMLIVDRPDNRLYEIYKTKKPAGAPWQGELALWKLDKAYPRSNRGKGCTSADAAGMAITPGLIGYKEVKKGEIRHALRLVLMNEYIRGKKGDKTVPNVVYPASHGSTQGNSATGVPYGARIRLKTALKDDDPRLKTPGAKALAKALRVYGAILSDGGNLPLMAESIKVPHDVDPAASWDGVLDPKDLDFLKPSDFEIIAIPKGDPSQPDAGWYQTKADYNGQVQTPLGCDAVVQPQ